VAQSILTRTPPLANRRIAYGADPNQVADLRLPDGDGPFPCVIAIHGGFWRRAYTLEHLGHLCAALTGAGFVTWNLEYRRIGDEGGGWSGTFVDIAAGSRYLCDHAGELAIDPARIVALGHSAGGHLAVWLASLANVPPASEIAAEPVPLAGAISLAGLLDLARAAGLDLSTGAAKLLMNGTPESVSARYAAASPLALVPSPVPVVAMHGGADEIVPADFSERYVAAAMAAGGAATLTRLAGVGHFELIDPESSAWPDVRAAVTAFAT